LTAVACDARAEGFSGADLSALVREAGLAVMREWMAEGGLASSIHTPVGVCVGVGVGVGVGVDVGVGVGVGVCVGMGVGVGVSAEPLAGPRPILGRHFEAAFAKVRPSVAPEDRLRYERVHRHIKAGLWAMQALREAAREGREARK